MRLLDAINHERANVALAWLARPALAQGVRPSDYAGLLVSLTAPPTSGGALGAGSATVANRVRAVLDSRSRSPRRGLVLGAALALGAGVSAAAAPPARAARDALDELSPTGFDPAGRALLATLREELARHFAALDVLGVHVTRPGPADLLQGRPAAAVTDLASLGQSADPVAAMAYAVDQITPTARSFDAPIEAATMRSASAWRPSPGSPVPAPAAPGPCHPVSPGPSGWSSAQRETISNASRRTRPTPRPGPAWTPSSR